MRGIVRDGVVWDYEEAQLEGDHESRPRQREERRQVPILEELRLRRDGPAVHPCDLLLDLLVRLGEGFLLVRRREECLH